MQVFFCMKSKMLPVFNVWLAKYTENTYEIH